MMRRDLALLVALLAGAVLLALLTRPLPTKEGVSSPARLPGEGVPVRVPPVEQSLLLSRPVEAAPAPDPWERALAAVTPVLVAVEAWSAPVPTGRATVLRGSGIFVSTQGDMVLPYELVADGRALRVQGVDGVVRAARAMAADRHHGLALARVAGVTSTPVMWGSAGLPRAATRVALAARVMGRPESFGFGLLVPARRGEVVADLAGIPEYLTVVGAGWGDHPGAVAVNSSGELVGVVRPASGPGAVAEETVLLPAAVVQARVQTMLKGGTPRRAYLGVAVQPVGPDLAPLLGLNEPKGALISDVLPEGPAEQAGLRPGDVVVRAGDFQVNNHTELRGLIARMPPEQALMLEVIRRGTRIQVDVRPAVREPAAELPPPPPELPAGESPLAAVVPVASAEGVRVGTYQGHWVVATQPLQPGDLILEINGEPVRNETDFAEARRRTQGAAAVLLRVDDGGMRRHLVLKRP